MINQKKINILGKEKLGTRGCIETHHRGYRVTLNKHQVTDYQHYYSIIICIICGEKSFDTAPSKQNVL